MVMVLVVQILGSAAMSSHKKRSKSRSHHVMTRVLMEVRALRMLMLMLMLMLMWMWMGDLGELVD